MGTEIGALFGSTRQAVLRLLFTHADKRFYQREIIRRLGIGSGAVQREIGQLVAARILERTAEGSQIYVQANAQCPIFAELRSVVRKTFGIADVLAESLEPLRAKIRFAFVYGSVAQGRESSSSDLDVMIIGDGLTLREAVSALAAAQTQLTREINPAVFETEEFYRRLAEGQHFFRALAAEEKLFVLGSNREFDGLAKERMASRARTERKGDRRSVRGRR